MEDFKDLMDEKAYQSKRYGYYTEYRKLENGEWKKCRIEEIRSGDIIEVADYLDEGLLRVGIFEAHGSCYINELGLKTIKVMEV